MQSRLDTLAFRDSRRISYGGWAVSLGGDACTPEVESQCKLDDGIDERHLPLVGSIDRRIPGKCVLYTAVLRKSR